MATFFTGSAFIVDKGAMGDSLAPVISRWANGWHGLDALAEPWNWVLGLAVFFLARVLGSLYFLNNIDDAGLQPRLRRQVLRDGVPFVVLFVGFVGRVLLGDGYAVDADGHIVLTPYKYALNLVQMPAVGATFLVGVALVLHGLLRTLWKPGFRRGIWSAGFGTVLAVTALLLAAGYNGTAYYPSTVSPGSSLTIANSSSSYFTLKTMAWVSLLIPVVVAYIAYAWYAIDRQSLTRKELEKGEHKY